MYKFERKIIIQPEWIEFIADRKRWLQDADGIV
jgi:hypothetical protein